MAKETEVDVVATIEKEEAKRKTKKPKGKSKKKQEKKNDVKQKKETSIDDLLPKKEKSISDTTKALPKELADQRIVCGEVGSLTYAVKVPLSRVIATSQHIYVDDIHHANPSVLQTIYFVIMPNTRHVIARITEEEYERIYKLTKTILNHHVSVIDCAVTPTLSYGSWKRSHLKDDFPTADQIEAYDKEFRENPTNFHNPPVKINIVEEDEEEDVFDFGEDDEEVEIDFTEED